ncbi:MAG: hypothetical protein ACE5FL_04835 [Myxococcota bacterium]
MGKIERIAPGHVRVVSSTRLFGFLFGSAGIGLAAGAVALLLHHGEPAVVAAFGVMSLLFLYVGLQPAWDRIALEIRPGSIDFERRARGSRQHRMLPREILLRVRCERVVRQGDKGSRVRYPVSLVFDAARLPDGLPETLAIRDFVKETQARSEAEALARDLDLTLEDAIGSEPVLRAPDELDARVRRKGDPGPPPSGLGVRWADGPADLEIASGTPAGRMLLVGLALASTAMSVAGLTFVFGFSGAGEMPVPVLAVAGGVELVFVAVLLSTAWLQHWRLSVCAGRLALEHRLGPLTVSRVSLAVEQIEGVRAERTGPLGSGVAILSDARILRIPQLRPEAAEWLRCWVAAYAGE